MIYISGSAKDPLIAKIIFGPESVKKDKIKHVGMKNSVLMLEYANIKYELVFADKETILIRADGASA